MNIQQSKSENIWKSMSCNREVIGRKWVYCIALQSNDDIDDSGDEGTDMQFEEDLYDDEKDEDDDNEYEKGKEEDENENVDENQDE